MVRKSLFCGVAGQPLLAVLEPKPPNRGWAFTQKGGLSDFSRTLVWLGREGVESRGSLTSIQLQITVW
jgi:hypothetical protein